MFFHHTAVLKLAPTVLKIHYMRKELMLMRKSGRTALKNLKNYFVNMFYTRRFYMYQPQEASSYFSFGFCILVGTIITWLLGK